MEAEQIPGLERVGADNGALQFAIVEVLGKAGWSPAFVGPEFGRDPAGSTVLTARKYGRDLRVVAPTRREAVSELLRQITRLERLPALQPADLAPVEEHLQLTTDEEQSWEDFWATLNSTGQNR